jgi:predicted Zn-dependent peptidase
MPDIQEVKNLTVPPPEVWHLPNGVPVYETNLGTQDIVKLELVFFAGRPYEKKKLAFRGTAALLKEGTAHHSSADIAEVFDYYGGTLALPVSLDTATVQFYSLSKHFDKLLPVLAEILAEPTFPEEELKPFIERNIQRLQVDLTKNDVVAYRKFTELLYGEEHPYGYNSFADTYSALTRDDLVEHYQANYVSGNCLLFLSGKITPQIRALMEQHLGNAILKGEKRTVAVGPGVNTPLTVKVPHPEKVQTAIRIGSHLFTRSHPDYNGMYVLNTILGGYFGSRLMANIREEKGYTYNIYSNHDSMLFGGYFYVATEVGNEFVEPTIREIYVEMQKLQDKLVKKDEMEMVRNYLLGTLLTNLDGPFNISEVVKTFISEGLPLSGFEELVETIKTISPKELRELARKYFKKENLWEVVV